MALLETLHRADSKLANSFREARAASFKVAAAAGEPEDADLVAEKSDESLLQSFFSSVSDRVTSGASAIQSSASSFAETVGQSASGVANFFKDLARSGMLTSASSEASATMSRGEAGKVRSLRSVQTSFTEQEDLEDIRDEHEAVEGVYGVDYSKYPISAYVKLPPALQPFVNLPWLDHYLVIAKPTMDKSGGLRGYREVCPKSVRAAAPFLIVVDEAGQAEGFTDKGYLWYEFKLVDVFKLDVRNMKTFDDYLAKLSKKGRWNCKDRQKKLKASPLKMEYVPIPKGDREFLDKLWPLYKQTGERNGFCVLDEDAFYNFHLNTPDLTVLMIKDTSKGDQLVTFCTGVRSNDVLMPMWCGTDYNHELAMKCATYFNMLYEYFRIAIEDPTINWVDLGATRRTAKTGIGCDGYPVSGYVRCKNSVMLALVDTMMQEYFHPEELMNDP